MLKKDKTCLLPENHCSLQHPEASKEGSVLGSLRTWHFLLQLREEVVAPRPLHTRRLRHVLKCDKSCLFGVSWLS